MPKRAHSNSENSRPQSPGRDLRSYANKSSLPKFVVEPGITSEAAGACEMARELRRSQAEAIRELGESLGQSEREIEAAVDVCAPDTKACGERHEDEIQAIIDAVGLSLKTSNIELSRDIGFAETLYWTALDIRRLRRVQKHLGRILKSAKLLKQHLNNEDAWKRVAPHVSLLFEVGSENRTFSRNSLDVLLRATEIALSSTTNSVEVLKEERPCDIIIAQLFKVFERHFPVKARINRSNEQGKQTPYHRFVNIVLAKTTLPKYDNDTIIRATSKARKAQQAA
jgi:hypothetical protein